MAQYIPKDALLAEIKKKKNPFKRDIEDGHYPTYLCALMDFENIINILEVKDPYEQRVQYDSIKAGIQAHAETYSFNIESKLFNQLTKEQQKLWRKEIEQACISGGEMGVELARDPRYKENLEVKEVDLNRELDDYIEKERAWIKDDRSVEYNNGDSFNHIYDLRELAEHFFELGLQISNKARKGE